ncbi:MAG TPA: phosphoribosylanthranilate isomerase [Pirellulales bacterium]|nr:phosphoribosylanthranilate isomerase [Pirellulales bacterium]
MFRVKICGITNVEDARHAAGAGADAIGINFYGGSVRAVTVDQGRAIAEAVPDGVAKVGVFVNAGAPEVRQTAERLKLDYVQLHGDEPPSVLGELAGLRVIRAFRLGHAGWQPLVDYLAECRRLDEMPVAILADACREGAFGGTGQAADWTVARQFHELHLGLPLILAGGLTPQNVAEAIAAVSPTAVDTASGVESSPGCKDIAKITAFIAESRMAMRGERL